MPKDTEEHTTNAEHAHIVTTVALPEKRPAEDSNIQHDEGKRRRVDVDSIDNYEVVSFGSVTNKSVNENNKKSS